MRSRFRYLDQGQCSWIRDWWRAMQPATTEDKDVPFALRALSRADRAKCRRCTTLGELELELAPNLLAAHLAEPTQAQETWLQKWLQGHYEALFLLAGVLAHVKEDVQDGQSLALRTGNAKATPDKPPRMSELRFKRLLRATDTEDFFRQTRRAVQLAGGVADVAVLADDLLSWSIEQDQQKRAWKPSESLKFRWARDYYLTAKEQSFSLSPDTKSDNASER
jgi:CRISPR system Cascade subunit CasB